MDLSVKLESIKIQGIRLTVRAERAIEYNLFYFKSSGKTQVLAKPYYGKGGPPDLADDSLFEDVNLDRKITNHVLGAYVNNKFKFGGLSLVPGVRSDYLELTGTATLDPRLALSYEFKNETTISVAGGQYSSSYTFTKAEYKSGVITNPDKGKWLPAEYEQPHSFKFLAGYVFGTHQIGLRFELNSGFPYTPITGADEKIPNRYSPEYGSPYSKRYPFSHRLDIRYSKDIKFTNSRLKWYIEVINLYNFKPTSAQNWNYSKTYSSSNPKLASNGIGIIPNLGLEYRF